MLTERLPLCLRFYSVIMTLSVRRVIYRTVRDGGFESGTAIYQQSGARQVFIYFKLFGWWGQIENIHYSLGKAVDNCYYIYT